MNLTREDQDLLETEFPFEIEKEAAEQAAVLSELYEIGFEKMASNAADEMDQEMFSSPEYRLSEYHIKEASARGAFLAQYYVEGLMKEGSDRHNDPLHYFYPAIDEYLDKIALDKKNNEKLKKYKEDVVDKRNQPVKGRNPKSEAAWAKAQSDLGKQTGKIVTVKPQPKPVPKPSAPPARPPHVKGKPNPYSETAIQKAQATANRTSSKVDSILPSTETPKTEAPKTEAPKTEAPVTKTDKAKQSILEHIKDYGKAIPKEYGEMWHGGKDSAGKEMSKWVRAGKGLKATARVAGPVAALGGLGYGGYKGYQHYKNKQHEGNQEER